MHQQNTGTKRRHCEKDKGSEQHKRVKRFLPRMINPAKQIEQSNSFHHILNFIFVGREFHPKHSTKRCFFFFSFSERNGLKNPAKSEIS
jgi:hypothetical protein